MQPYPAAVEQQMKRFYQSLSEKDRRRYAAVEALKLGRGGVSYISQLLGCDDEAMQLGKQELQDQARLNQKRIRRPGGGRKSAFETHPNLDQVFLKVIAQHTAGSPMSDQIKWTNLTRQEIAQLMQTEGISISVTVVDQLLVKHHYRQRKAQKRLATGSHPDRHAQFDNIAAIRSRYETAGNPVLSMDTKKEN
jgi:hypothetical protein